MSPSRLVPGVQLAELLPVDDDELSGTYSTFWGNAFVHAKEQDPTKPYMLANELIGARLAARMGLPTLPGEISSFPNDGRTYWVTPRIAAPAAAGRDAIVPPPAQARDIAAAYPNIVVGMIVLDAWIHNIDRTDYNVLYSDRLGIWLIDHENALAEPDGRAFDSDPRQCARQPLSHHDFAGLVPTESREREHWVRQVQQIGEDVISRVVGEAYSRHLISRPQERWLNDYLVGRRDGIMELFPSTQPARLPVAIQDGLFTEH